MFEGRQDRQIKLRGYRIEMGQVERAVESCIPDVEVLCDVVQKDTPAARLVVWIASTEQIDMVALESNLATSLPAFMRPAFIQLPEFPRTANGKIDRSALRRPEETRSPVTEPGSAATDLEIQISQIMADVLNLSEIDPDQNFFDLGGHSLLSIEFIGRIEIETGMRLGFVEFRQNASPRELAKILETADRDSKNIIPIQPVGTKIPLLAIHILGANEEYFRPLAKHLGPDQPIMGISVGSLDANTPSGVKSTARRYCKEINKHYPDGPIRLMAASLGSYIAFELAQQLHASGRKVGMLALFDAAGPDGRASVRGIGRVVARLRYVRSVGWKYPAQFLRNVIYEVRNKVAQVRYTRKSQGDENVGPKTVFEFIASNELAVNDYTPRPIDVPLTIFRSNMNYFDTGETRENGLGWLSVAKGGFTVIDVPGGHLSMLQEPHVPAIAKKLKAILDADE